MADDSQYRRVQAELSTLVQMYGAGAAASPRN
jgi:hypothetical protein